MNMPKLALEEIDQVINKAAEGIAYARLARLVARKVHGDPREVEINMKIAYACLREAMEVIECKPQPTAEGE
jgi:hypothetical protein